MPSPPAPAKRPCVADDLNVSVGSSGARDGRTLQTIQVDSKSSSACVLGSPALVRSSLASGEAGPSRAPLAHGDASTDSVSLQPGDGAFIALSAPGACVNAAAAHQPILTSAVVRFAGREWSLHGMQLNIGCGDVEISPPMINRMTDSEMLPAVPLTASITSPPSVRAGSTLTYTVELTNLSDSDVSWDSQCPVFTEGLVGGTAVSFYLNCAAVRHIPAHGSALFDMQLPVSRGTPHGGVKMFWHLDGGVAGGTIVNVT